MLNTEKFAESHTGDNIAAKVNCMLEKWNIEKWRVHFVVSDNGANVTAGFRKADVA